MQTKQYKPIGPSRNLIAFAIAVVTSKPQELSVGEYIRQLRHHVAKGRRQEAVSAVYHHLDRSSYWRAEYERTKDALNAADGKIIDLQRQVDSLKGRLDVNQPPSRNKKRKKRDEDILPVQRSPKKARPQASPPRSLPLSIETILDEVESSEGGETRIVLLRNIFRIHAILKGNVKNETSNLAYHLVKISTAIPLIIDAEVKVYLSKPTANLEHFKSTLTLAARASMAVLIGFSRLSKSPNSNALSGNVIYAFVNMFKDLLQGLEQLSERGTQLTETNPSAGEKSWSATSKNKGNPIKTNSINEGTSLNCHTRFLASLIDMLDPKTEAHQSLFEGFAFCVFDRIGVRLFTSIFGHARAPTMEREVLASYVAGAEQDVNTLPSPKDEMGQKQINLEAPYLIHLLQRIMAVAPSFLGSINGKKPSKPKNPNSKASTKGILAISAKECLQRTLVNSIFGTETCGDKAEEEDPFGDCLKMPIAGTASISMPKAKETDLQEWYKEEVWRLLGWEILGNEDGWDCETEA